MTKPYFDPDELLTPDEAEVELEGFPAGADIDHLSCQLRDDAIGLPEPLYTVGCLLEGHEREAWRRASYRERAALVMRAARRLKRVE